MDDPPAEFDLFSIQDFTTVSPFEKIIKLLQRQLRQWEVKEAWSSNLAPIKLAAILPINELERRHYVRLTATRMKPIKGPFYAKASKYQRWFNLHEYFALEFLHDKNGERVGCMRFETANTLLNALGIALSASDLPCVPVLVCRDGGPSDHHIGFQMRFQEGGMLKVSEYQALSSESGEELLHSLLDLLKDPDLDSPLTRSLSQVVSKDIHLAALGFLYFTHLRIPLPLFNPNVNMRWVYVIESWPPLSDIIGSRSAFSEELADLTPCPAEDVLPVRSLHIFFTWSFTFWESLKLQPLTVKPQPLMSLRPLFAFDPSQSPLSSALSRLCYLMEDTTEHTTETPSIQAAKQWLSKMDLYNTRLSLGERLIYTAFQSSQDAQEFASNWSGFLTLAKSCIQCRQPLVDLRSQMLLNAGGSSNLPLTCFPISRFPIARHLDTILIASTQAHLRQRLEAMDADTILPERLAYALVGLILTPTPVTAERETMIKERIAQAESLKLQRKQSAPIIEQSDISDQDVRIHTTFIRGAILTHLLLSRPKEEATSVAPVSGSSVAALSDYYALWRSVTGTTNTDDRSARGLSSPQCETTDVSKLWSFSRHVAEMRHPTLTDYEFLFPDELYDAEKSLQSLEEMSIENTLNGMFELLLHRSCRLIYTQCQEVLDAGHIILKPLTKCVGVQVAKQLCKWQPEIFAPIPTLSQTRLQKRQQLTTIITHTEKLLFVATALYTKLNWMSQATVVDLASTVDDELVVENEEDRESVLEVVKRGGQSMAMEDITEGPGLGGEEMPPPFLKEFIFTTSKRRLYSSWSDQDFRVAWDFLSSEKF